MKILIIEDDASTVAFIRKGLTEAGYSSEHVNNGIQGLQYATQDFFDLIILDIMLPGRDGLSVLENLRANHIETPVLVLSAKQSVDDRVTGLRKGADDYLTKPFAFSELLARVQALLRRHAQTSPQAVRMQVDDLEVNLLSREAIRSGQNIVLQAKEFDLLAFLMKNTGIVVSKTMILDRVWDYHFHPSSNIVEAMISKLREKIDKPFEKKLIHTIRGSGYLLKSE